MKKSWKTTLFATLSGIASIVATYSPPGKTKDIAAIVAAAMLALTGGVARDNNVTSEQAGIKPQ